MKIRLISNLCQLTAKNEDFFAIQKQAISRVALAEHRHHIDLLLSLSFVWLRIFLFSCIIWCLCWLFSSSDTCEIHHLSYYGATYVTDRKWMFWGTAMTFKRFPQRKIHSLTHYNGQYSSFFAHVLHTEDYAHFLLFATQGRKGTAGQAPPHNDPNTGVGLTFKTAAQGLVLDWVAFFFKMLKLLRPTYCSFEWVYGLRCVCFFP